MLRLPLRSYFACLLLLCLTRTPLPEAWVLALHAHAHTTEELAWHASRTAHARPGQPVLTPKHAHCQTEQFYRVPFQGASPVLMPLPRVQLSYRPLAVPTTPASSAAGLRRRALRGPPVG